MSLENLVFFNKEGDYLNFSKNQSTNIVEGDILFHENSSDTFKTYGLYMMERIPSFEFELPGELTTKRFQLFNEYGFHFYGSNNQNKIVNKIEPINNDPKFYSKWIYGINFEVLFPKGTLIQINKEVLEFNNTQRTYCVVATKKNAIMIIGQMDNASFELTYQEEYTDLNSDLYNNLTISGINAIGVYNYINENYENNLSSWNEEDFYDYYHLNKKLNIINSEENNTTYTVDNIELTDLKHFEYFINKSELPENSNLIMEVATKTDLPKVYEGGMVLDGNYKIYLTLNHLYPQILKPEVEFKIVGANNNENFLNVDYIPRWDGIVNTTTFNVGDQVIYNNIIYECITQYTQDFSDININFTAPSDENYWTKFPTYIKVRQELTNETLLNAQIYLTTDKFYYTYEWNGSSKATLASMAQLYNQELRIFGLDLFYEKDYLKADLIYPSDYCEVNFYYDELLDSNLIGDYKEVRERLVGVEEYVDSEFNYDISENFNMEVVFTDIDTYGIKIFVNGMEYDEETALIYTGSEIDMERTIDRTLRNWLTRHYVRLYTLGIDVELKFTGNYSSIFYNTIVFRTQYPNVPFYIDEVLVGSTADYHINHSTVNFINMGAYLSINVNGTEYGIETIYGSGTNLPNISQTLTNWVSEYKDILNSFGVLVESVSSLLIFNVKYNGLNLRYNISTGNTNIPGIDDYTIKNHLTGNHGALITSNSVILPSDSNVSFEESGFATGMVFSINNTIWPFVNQDFNIQYLDPQVMNLSYQGPFWGLSGSICNSSAFVTLAFDLGFGQEDCIIDDGMGGTGGPFEIGSFATSSFALSMNQNDYSYNNYNYSEYIGLNTMVDIKYVQISNSLYVFGDNIVVLDSFNTNIVSVINLNNGGNSIKMIYNIFNDYLYFLSELKIFVVDPITNTIVNEINLNGIGYDIIINESNGDVYVSYSNEPFIDVWAYNNFNNPTDTLTDNTGTKSGMMAYNSFEGDVYVTTDSDVVLRYNADRSLQISYGISNLQLKCKYEPVNESVYVYSDVSLYKIDNGDIIQISGVSYESFNEIMFNNLTGDMNVSNNTNNFIKVSLDDDSISQSSILGHGFMKLNQFDGDVYISNQILNNVLIVSPTNGLLLDTVPLSGYGTIVEYNPDKKSMWVIIPEISGVTEIEVTINSTIDILTESSQKVGENQYGTLSDEYVAKDDIWLKTRDYIRRPREKFEGETPVVYYWKWLTDERPEFFFYDFSGDYIQATGSYSYTGPKPLTNAVLNRKENRDITKVSKPEYQKTIFDEIYYELSYIDDEDDVTIEVEPLQLFIGYKSEIEGEHNGVMQLMKREPIEFYIDSDENNYFSFETIEDSSGKYSIIKVNTLSEFTFYDKELSPGQNIVIYLSDISNDTNQYVSDNNASMFIIKDVFSKSLILDFFKPTDMLFEESSKVEDYPSIGDTTFLKFGIKVKDKEIGRFNVYGQTEEEDERFKIELSNIGKLVNPDEVFIFKKYDILEGGIDWTILNKKRKEMLMNKHLIYPYIGAYKSIINSINYFGYNSLILNEYYKNIDSTSADFLKLTKIEIPDIFDNTVDGWTENDFIKNSLPNEIFEGTNLFNLTYLITDKEGNNLLFYSLDEVIIKLQGLKYWLQRNIIPLTHKILDITGQAYFNTGNHILHRLHDVKIFNIKENLSPVSFKLNEAYLMPVNSGSTVYNCVLDFYNINSQNLNDDNYIRPYNYAKLQTPDYFQVNIRTYKTYKEWNPFVTYNKGDKVRYYDKLYESVVDANRTLNPKKYDDVFEWSSNKGYKKTNIVKYKNEYYVYSAIGEPSFNNPIIDTINWVNVTEWREIKLEPVQYIKEFRNGDDLKSFNFTIDSNIDPFITIEVITENGYGQTFGDRKNYEIRGNSDLPDSRVSLDKIGPIQVITPIY